MCAGLLPCGPGQFRQVARPSVNQDSGPCEHGEDEKEGMELRNRGDG